jgi:hypothetical protein
MPENAMPHGSTSDLHHAPDTTRRAGSSVASAPDGLTARTDGGRSRPSQTAPCGHLVWP